MKKKEKKEIKFKIWTSIIDHEDMLAWIDELNKIREDEDGEDYEEATETDVYAENNFYLDDEKSNLNLLVPGVIVYFGKYNCRAKLYHHDGTNRILFR